jgi:hypothetical protein
MNPEAGEDINGAGAASLKTENIPLEEPVSSRCELGGLRTSRILLGKREEVLGVVGRTLTEA